MTVVVDTNALMMPVECNVRLFDELDRLLDAPTLLTPEAVIRELEQLAEGGSEEAKAASVGLDLAERCECRATEADYADDAVIELAEREQATHVVTNDGPLKQRVLDAGVSVISLRGRSKLATTQP